MIRVTRIITLEYPTEEIYIADRKYWQLPDEGQGTFGPWKRWKQRIEVGYPREAYLKEVYDHLDKTIKFD